MVVRFILFNFFWNRQQHSSWSCRHFHVSLHADGRLKLWLRPSSPSVRVQVLPGPEHLSLHPNWNQKRNAIRSAWPDAEEGWLRVRPSKEKKEKGQSTQTSFMLPWGSSGGIQINSLWYCHRFISCVNLSSPGIFFFFESKNSTVSPSSLSDNRHPVGTQIRTESLV